MEGMGEVTKFDSESQHSCLDPTLLCLCAHIQVLQTSWAVGDHGYLEKYRKL
jgi:hypothetical protein